MTIYFINLINKKEYQITFELYVRMISINFFFKSPFMKILKPNPQSRIPWTKFFDYLKHSGRNGIKKF